MPVTHRLGVKPAARLRSRANAPLPLDDRPSLDIFALDPVTGRVLAWDADRLAATIGFMAYDDALAGRIRNLIGPDPELTEKKMFGGLAFLIRGHIAISASGQGGVLVRVDPGQCDELVATTSATVAVMGGREMPGWLRVSAEDLSGDELSAWVEIGIGQVRSLPPTEYRRR